MPRSNRRSEYLDLPDRPNSATMLDQVLGYGYGDMEGIISYLVAVLHSRIWYAINIYIRVFA
jgi:hypothetical protein